MTHESRNANHEPQAIANHSSSTYHPLACRALVRADSSSFATRDFNAPAGPDADSDDGCDAAAAAIAEAAAAAAAVGGGRANEGGNWLKQFMHRSYEALMVESVVTNVEQRIDRVLEWVAFMTNRTPLEVANLVNHNGSRTNGSKHGSENGHAAVVQRQALLEVVIEALYHFEADRTMLKQGKWANNYIVAISHKEHFLISYFTEFF